MASSPPTPPSAVVAVEKQLEELYRIHDYEFNLDKQEKSTKMQQSIDKIVETLTSSEGVSKAFAAYAQGKAFNATEAFNPEAEKLLSRAVKLDEANIAAWNALGTCFWKKGDVLQARRCFEGATKRTKNQVSERELSMLLRDTRLVAPSEDKKADVQRLYSNYKAALAHAKTAVSLDVRDGRSWYSLGNVYLHHFFHVSQATADLNRALTAYKNAEKNGEGDRNPDLHFNRANVYKYMEQYTEAAASYQRAMQIDPQLPAEAQLSDMRRHFKKVSLLLQKRLKPKRFDALLQDLPTDAIVAHPCQKNTFCDVVAFSDCSEGSNEGKAVFIKCIMLARSGGEPPAIFLASDKERTVMPISVYNLSEEVSNAHIQSTAVITLIEPTFVEISLGSESYTAVQITDPRHFMVNGKVLAHAIAPPQHKARFSDQ